LKRIDILTKSEHVRQIADALKKIGVGGVTVVQVRGRGSSEVPIISGLRGTAKFVADFNSRNLIYTIVDDSNAEEVISTILGTVESTGEKGMGKIFVTPVDDAIDLGTKSRGTDAL
jgi:nitrogen regulatory protein P-II 1